LTKAQLPENLPLQSASENDTEASEADDEAAATSEDDELGDDDELPGIACCAHLHFVQTVNESLRLSSFL